MAYHFIDSYILPKQNWFSAKLLTVQKQNGKQNGNPI